MATVEDTITEQVALRTLMKAGWPLGVSEGADASDGLALLDGKRVEERFRVQGAPVGNWLGRHVVQEQVRLGDGVFRAQFLALSEAMSASDTLAAVLVYNLADQLKLVSTLSAGARFEHLMAEAIKLSDGLARFVGVDLGDVIEFAEAVAARALAKTLVAETIEISASLAPQFMLQVVARDGVAITPDQAVRMLYQPTIAEDVEISAGYLAPDGGVTTWSMNTRTGAVTEYRNFAFNSFANFGNVYLAASDQGLYELLGDSDDGEDIIARLRSGYLQFGGTRLSRLKAAYISARGEGDVYLKIVTSEGVEYVYKVPTRDMRSTKVHMGKGQRARYFAYELTTVGQDFDLDTIEFVPIVVQRRV